MNVFTIKDVNTESLIENLRVNAKRLIQDSSLYTIADLMKEAANRLEATLPNKPKERESDDHGTLLE